MGNITLQEQIDNVDKWSFFDPTYTDAILASLKRLQAIEGQKAVGAVARLNATNRLVFTEDIKLVDTWIIRGEVHEKSKMEVYALPPDAQGMIDKLTAERDALRKLLAQGEAIGSVEVKRDLDNGDHIARVICTHDQADWENFPDATKLYLAAGNLTAPPAKPVVNIVVDDAWFSESEVVDAEWVVGEDNDGWYIAKGGDQKAWSASEEFASVLCNMLNATTDTKPVNEREALEDAVGVVGHVDRRVYGEEVKYIAEVYFKDKPNVGSSVYLCLPHCI